MTQARIRHRASMKSWFAIILISCLASGCSTWSAREKETHQPVDEAVMKMLEGKNVDFEILRSQPVHSAKLLVDSLHTANVDKLNSEEQPGHPYDMRAVRAIRALRRLTGCDFLALTSYKFQQTETDEERKDLLLEHENRSKPMPFFTTRMSTDTVYFAPKDVQESVIQEWKKWEATQLKHWNFPTNVPLDNWYF
jgi:hypothetical protein